MFLADSLPISGAIRLTSPENQRSTVKASCRITWANCALDGLWQRGWAERPTLDPDALVSLAERRVGARTEDDGSGWRQRLSLLCDELEGEARLTSLGRTIAHGQLVSSLANRFRAEALWRRHPAILDQPLAPPIVVLGQMRSGSTRMQRLLARDPRFTFTRFFESWNPLPLGEPRQGLDDRRWRSAAGLAAARLLNPDFAAIHETGLDLPDEEIGFLGLSVFGAALEAQWRVPRFARACEESDTRPVYADFRRLLQTIAWLRGERGDRPWILKVPQLTQDLAAVLDAFPGARLVCLSRDPAALVASSASLVRNQMALQSKAVDPHWIGREWLRKVTLRARRVAEVRRSGTVPAIDVTYDAMEADWMGEMTRLYRFLEVAFTPDVRRRMAAFANRGRAARIRAGHRYELAEFGLNASEVRRVVTAAAG